MGYGTSGWGDSWGDPVSGFALGSISVSSRMGLGSALRLQPGLISVRNRLTCSGASARTRLTPTSIINNNSPGGTA